VVLKPRSATQISNENRASSEQVPDDESVPWRRRRRRRRQERVRENGTVWWHVVDVEGGVGCTRFKRGTAVVYCSSQFSLSFVVCQLGVVEHEQFTVTIIVSAALVLSPLLVSCTHVTKLITDLFGFPIAHSELL
jgi:hypothetical protein